MSNENPKIPDFEKALEELESLVQKMEQGELSLEESLEHFERGVRLTRTCQEALEQAQLRIEQLDTDQTDAAGPEDAAS